MARLANAPAIDFFDRLSSQPGVRRFGDNPVVYDRGDFADITVASRANSIDDRGGAAILRRNVGSKT
jgi:hypothetical protein